MNLLENLKNKLEAYRVDYHNISCMLKSTTNELKKKSYQQQLETITLRGQSCKRCIAFLNGENTIGDLHELEAIKIIDYIFQ